MIKYCLTNLTKKNDLQTINIFYFLMHNYFTTLKIKLVLVVICSCLIIYSYLKKSDIKKKKYLLPIYIPDQESNAQKYIKNVFSIAIKSNRILVLPQIEDGRLTICGKYRFDTYYSLSSLKNYKNLKYIFYEDFIKINNLKKLKEILIFKDNKKKFIYPNCIEKLYLLNKNVAETTDNINTYLNKNKNEDIVMFSYESHSKKYCYEDKNCDINLEYNDKYKQLFNSIKNEINSTYIALHWRMENTNPNELIHCSKKLIKFTKKVKLYNNINKVIFLTDYPHYQIHDNLPNINIGESKTFKNITNMHKNSVDYIKNKLSFVLTVNNYILKDDKRYLYVNTTFLDSSSLGIIDKLLAINSYLFLASSEYCSGRNSSYVNHIITERNKNNKKSYYWDKY